MILFCKLVHPPISNWDLMNSLISLENVKSYSILREGCRWRSPSCLPANLSRWVSSSQKLGRCTGPVVPLATFWKIPFWKKYAWKNTFEKYSFRKHRFRKYALGKYSFHCPCQKLKTYDTTHWNQKALGHTYDILPPTPVEAVWECESITSWWRLSAESWCKLVMTV